MSLIDNFKCTCTILNKIKEPDGAGGFLTVWQDGAEFEAAITFDTSLQARIAEHSGVHSLYKVTAARDLGLEFHDVFRRNTDGKIFRVTSDGDDVLTPEVATFSFSQVTAEEWRLTT